MVEALLKIAQSRGEALSDDEVMVMCQLKVKVVVRNPGRQMLFTGSDLHKKQYT